ncbi:SnoaL-like domain-containing protein [Flagellimonas sp. DF-77]|uniref:SnoaL-like domain-containing protein n=1 Tax=Flagellimonas algarum TaxID=3230298 RepID=UPI0033923FF7
MMTNQEIANRLVELLNHGQFETVYNELFHSNAEHIEPQSEQFAHLQGLDAIKAKDAAMSAHIASVEGPEVGQAIVARSHIGVPYKMKVTLKDGSLMDLDELIVYHIENGKIMEERFFY